MADSDGYKWGVDMSTPVRHVATMLEEARVSGTGVSIEDVASAYTQGNTADNDRFRHRYNLEKGADPRPSIVREVIDILTRSRGKEPATVESDGLYMLAVPLTSVRWNGQKIHPAQPRSEFLTTLALIRRKEMGDLDGLAELLKSAPWILKHQPIIRDAETRAILAGNRRFAAALKAGLTQPEMEEKGYLVDRNFPDDASKYATFLLTNVAQKPFTKSEKADIARYLCEDEGLSQAEVAKRLGVSQPRVSEMLGELSDPIIRHTLRGRPRNVTPAQEKEIIRRVLDEGEHKGKVAQDVLHATEQGRSRVTVENILARELGRREVWARLGTDGPEPAPESEPEPEPDETSTRVDIPEPEPEPVIDEAPPAPPPVKPPPKLPKEPKPFREPEPEHEHDWEKGQRCRACGGWEAA